MTPCAICGEPLRGVRHAENAFCGSCYELNLAGNRLDTPPDLWGEVCPTLVLRVPSDAALVTAWPWLEEAPHA